MDSCASCRVLGLLRGTDQWHGVSSVGRAFLPARSRCFRHVRCRLHEIRRENIVCCFSRYCGCLGRFVAGNCRSFQKGRGGFCMLGHRKRDCDYYGHTPARMGNVGLHIVVRHCHCRGCLQVSGDKFEITAEIGFFLRRSFRRTSIRKLQVLP